MRRARAKATQPVRKAERYAEIEAPLQELLDHLGRLLAREYITVLTEDALENAAPEQGR
jgi:hypothetical protein